MSLKEAARESALPDVNDDHCRAVEHGAARARHAPRMTLASTAAKNLALAEAAAAIRRSEATILAENARDVADMKKEAGSASFIDRLTLTPARIEAMARGLEEIAALPDPNGTCAYFWPPRIAFNGLRNLCRVCAPLGAAGIIYKSRPNGRLARRWECLCLKARWRRRHPACESSDLFPALPGCDPPLCPVEGCS